MKYKENNKNMKTVNLNLLEKLNKYSLTRENIQKFNLEKNIDTISNISNKQTTNKNKVINSTSTINTPLYIPLLKEHRDTLFWIYFIIKNGYSEYESIKNTKKMFQTERDLKYSLIQLIESIVSIENKGKSEKINNPPFVIDKKTLKKYKINIKDVINDIGNSMNNMDGGEVITRETFIFLCLLSNLNVIIRKNNRIEHIKGGMSPQTPHDSSCPYCPYCPSCPSYPSCPSCHCYLIDIVTEIDKNKKDTTKYLLLREKVSIEDIKKKYYLVDNLEKPKGLSSYTLGELQEIATKLKINIYQEELEPDKAKTTKTTKKTKNKTKQQLYNEIMI